LKQNMLEPFVRGDDARNMDEAAGFGLGLSITNAIVLAHGGALSLHDRQPHGLVVRMRLPVRQPGERFGLEDDFSGGQAASASGCASS
jgi:signal transduction histidine kinase